jgi:ligand-binding sensor domain-containing protein
VGRFGSTDSIALPVSPDGLGPWNGVPGAEVRWILQADGRRWAGTDRGIVVERDGAWRWIVHDGPGSNDITTVAARDGSLLVGTFDRGAWRDGSPLALGSAEVNDALIDDDGVAWIATSRGLARVGDDVRTFGGVHGLASEHVGAVAHSAEGLWVGSSAGVQRFEGGSFGPLLGGEDAFKVAHVYDLLSTGEEIFAGTLEGLWSVRRGSATGYRYESGELPDSWINGVTRGPQGRLWAGTYDSGLALRDTDGRWRWLLEGEDLSCGWVNPGALAALPDGTVLVGTMGGGLLRVGPSGEIERWTMADGLAGDDVTSIAIDHDIIWVGTRSGLTRLEVTHARAS